MTESEAPARHAAGYQCPCGAPLSRRRKRCDRCRDAGKHRRQYLSRAFLPAVGAGSSHDLPGHDARLALYGARAALGLPLFAGVPRHPGPGDLPAPPPEPAPTGGAS